MRFPRSRSRSFFTALIIWGVSLLVLFLVVDNLLMPWAVGRFRATVEVPSVIGLEPAEAENLLRAQRLVLELDSAVNDYSAVVPRGRILSQSPAAGARVKEGRGVWAGLSEGREPYVVPDGGL